MEQSNFQNYFNQYNINDSFNSFHYFDNNKEEIFEIEIEKANSSAIFPFIFNKVFDPVLNKRNTFDMSDEEDHIFVDKLNISEIKPLYDGKKII